MDSLSSGSVHVGAEIDQPFQGKNSQCSLKHKINIQSMLYVYNKLTNERVNSKLSTFVALKLPLFSFTAAADGSYILPVSPKPHEIL